MKRLKKQIELNVEKLEKNPFFEYLRSPTISTKEKLTKWIPVATFFVFGFKDWVEFVLPYPKEECEDDIFKKAINDHCEEDSTHWNMFLKDLDTLGLNSHLNVSSALSFLWGKSSQNIRDGFYKLLAITEKAHTVQLRYCLIEALESYATVLFTELTKLGTQYEEETGQKLLYLGQTHLDLEDGHAQYKGEGVSEKFWKIELDENDYEVGLDIVNQVYENVDQRRMEYYIAATANQKIIW